MEIELFWEVDLRMVGVRVTIGLPLKNEDLGDEEREVVRDDAVAMAAIGGVFWEEKMFDEKWYICEWFYKQSEVGKPVNEKCMKVKFMLFEK